MNRLGARVIDKRTSLGRALARWRADLVADLGGPEAVSVQQGAILDLCVREKLMVDSLDAWIIQQPSLVNRRSRSAIPILAQRTQIADAPQHARARREGQAADQSHGLHRSQLLAAGARDATRQQS